MKSPLPGTVNTDPVAVGTAEGGAASGLIRERVGAWKKRRVATGVAGAPREKRSGGGGGDAGRARPLEESRTGGGGAEGRGEEMHGKKRGGSADNARGEGDVRDSRGIGSRRGRTTPGTPRGGGAAGRQRWQTRGGAADA
jgi:hypothetical protein